MRRAFGKSTHGDTFLAGAKNRLGYWPCQGLHCSLHDEQEQDRALTRALPNANRNLHFRIILANLYIYQSVLVKANQNVDEVIRPTEATEYCKQSLP